MKVTMKVTQLTEGTAILRSLPATTKLFRRDASWFRPNGSRNRQLAKRLPRSPKSLATKPSSSFYGTFSFFSGCFAVPLSMKALVVPHRVPTRRKLRIDCTSITKLIINQ